jgi:hypothetical protein
MRYPLIGMILLATVCANNTGRIDQARGTMVAIKQLSTTVQGEPSATTRCPRPQDAFGPRYQTLTGTFQSLGVSPFGGKVAIITTTFATAPQAVPLTDAMYEALREVQPGTPVTFFAYVSSSASGAMTPYTCVEF